jgi:hypothetical protein
MRPGSDAMTFPFGASFENAIDVVVSDNRVATE